MEVREDGSVILFRDLQSRNAEGLMEVTESGSVILLRNLQP